MGDSETEVSGNQEDAADEIERLNRLIDIATELAGHVNRPIALGREFDRKVLQYWTRKFFEAKRDGEPF